MNAVRQFPMLATAGLLALAAWAPHAVAGHLNPLLEASLDGREEVAAADASKKPGDRNARGQAYVFGIDADAADRTTLCYILNDFKNLAELDQAPGNGRAAHIHKGARGENGPVVVNLAWPQDGQAADCLSENTAGKFVNGGSVKDILANPQNYYVNVHNSEFPAGAVRGQLQSGEGHAHSHGGKGR